MTKEQAEFVKGLRLGGHSWRSIASHYHAKWGHDFELPWNQLAGIQLWLQAGDTLGEDPSKWDDEAFGADSAL